VDVGLGGPNTKLSGLQKPSTIVFSRAIGLRNKSYTAFKATLPGSVTGSMILKRRELPARPATVPLKQPEFGIF
jgi:hypothetical protein